MTSFLITTFTVLGHILAGALPTIAVSCHMVFHNHGIGEIAIDFVNNQLAQGDGLNTLGSLTQNFVTPVFEECVDSPNRLQIIEDQTNALQQRLEAQFAETVLVSNNLDVEQFKQKLTQGTLYKYCEAQDVESAIYADWVEQYYIPDILERCNIACQEIDNTAQFNNTVNHFYNDNGENSPVKIYKEVCEHHLVNGGLSNLPKNMKMREGLEKYHDTVMKDNSSSFKSKQALAITVGTVFTFVILNKIK